ncbi:variable surface protein [Plasmodium gonderi]|uniref:Variable surface protein n=1 Tax=Plasmodium gonderi TaxID=77519 RepID=A0A1Y1JRF7_PLAGO|nr:variable surface protein [Plasmodium gonderi]GAW84075.1 variable surface protein [Plasmodium gonderi]
MKNKYVFFYSYKSNYKIIIVYDYIEKLYEPKRRMYNDIGYGKSRYDFYCKNVTASGFNKSNSEHINICLDAKTYMLSITGKYRNHNYEDENIYCLYLFYWLYHNLMKKTNQFVDVKSMLYQVLNAYGRDLGGFDNLCKDYKNIITDYDLIKISHLYDVYKCIKGEYDNELREDDYFCVAIKKLVENYNTEMKAHAVTHTVPMETIRCPSNIKSPIIITVLAMVITLTFLFIMFKVNYDMFYKYFFYKNTKYGSNLQRVIKRIKNKLSISSESEMRRRDSSYNRYNILNHLNEFYY